MKLLLLASVLFFISCKKENGICGLTGSYLQKEAYQNSVKVDSSTDSRYEITTFDNRPIAMSLIYINHTAKDSRNILVQCENVYERTDSSFKLGSAVNYIYFVRVK